MDTMITGVTLIDGTGSSPVESATVLIAADHIAAVGKDGELPASGGPVEHWHLPNLTLLPGLIDAHVHILEDEDPRDPFYPVPSSETFALHGARNARLTLEAGFTTVRDVAAVNRTIFALRQAIADGTLSGPRIVASGKCLTVTGGHGTEYGFPMAWEVDTAEEFRKAVRKQLKAGADFIKVIATRSSFTPPYQGMPAFSVEELLPGIEEAHAAGLLVAAHASVNVEGIRNTVEAGVDTVEHGSPADDSTLDVMKAKGTMLVPTICVWAAVLERCAQGKFKGPPALREILPQRYAAVLDTVRRARDRGIPIVLGTDAPAVPHGTNAAEFGLLIEAGLSPMETIVAATANAARACGRGADLGTIEPGKLADCILVDGDPLQSVSILSDKERIKLVLQNGKVVVNRGLEPTKGN